MGCKAILTRCNTLGYFVFMTTVTWDPKKAEANLKKHGISFEEAETVFFGGPVLERPDLDHSEHRTIMLGFSAVARLLIVVYAERFGTEIRIISARKADAKERRQYAEKL